MWSRGSLGPKATLNLHEDNMDDLWGIFVADALALIWASLGSSAAETISRLLIAAAIGGSLWGLLQQRKAVQTLVALDFCKRYEAWNEDAPFEIMEAQSLAELDEERRKSILHSVERYANLCSEEHALWKQGRVPKDIWAVWEHGIRQNFERPLWREAWSAVRVEYDSTPGFQKFVDRIAGVSPSRPL